MLGQVINPYLSINLEYRQAIILQNQYLKDLVTQQLNFYANQQDKLVSGINLCVGFYLEADAQRSGMVLV